MKALPALALWALIAPAGAVERPLLPMDETPYASPALSRCTLVSRMFYRAAEQRDAGVPLQAAARRVNAWAARMGRTGSNIKWDYRRAAAASAKFAYAHRELHPSGLGYYGFRSCQIAGLFAGDEVRSRAGQIMLLDAAVRCQRANPGRRHNPPLDECIHQSSRRITERVRRARIVP